MIGRKLTERLVIDRALGDHGIEKLTLIDIVAPARPAGFSDHVKTRAADLAAPGVAEKAIVGAAGRDLPSRRRGVGRGGDRFREGLSGQSRRHPRAARGGAPGRRGYKPKFVFTSSIAVFGAPFPPCDPRRFPSHAAHLLRHAEGDLRIAARRLHPARLSRRRRHPPALDRACDRASRTRRRPVSFPASSASRSPAKRRCCRSPTACCIGMPARARRSDFSSMPPA